MATELNADLAMRGLPSATVAATASDVAAGRRRLQQGGYGGAGSGATDGISCIVVYVIVIPIPSGQTAADVAGAAQTTATATAKSPGVLMALLKVSLEYERTPITSWQPLQQLRALAPGQHLGNTRRSSAEEDLQVSR
jgi:hypothetical protein